MRFTNSPYESFMKQPSYYRGPPPGPLPAPKGTRCHGCPYWRGIVCMSCYRELLKKPDKGR